MTDNKLRSADPELEHQARQRPSLVLAALGVVYGDIGTSPLYAFREALHAGRPEPGKASGFIALPFCVLSGVAIFDFIQLGGHTQPYWP
ncbi:hypothetical protein EHI42_28510 [Rhizobium hidalgonense]|nr:hypothetical protein EHI42_28510 [Rhizobium hidalgonense]